MKDKEYIKEQVIEQEKDKEKEKKVKCKTCGDTITLKLTDINIEGENLQDYSIKVPDYCSDKCRAADEL